MKNFSLKALGAFIFAAGLVVAGVAAPAQAAPITSPSVTTSGLVQGQTNPNPIVISMTTPTGSNGANVTIPSDWSWTQTMSPAGTPCVAPVQVSGFTATFCRYGVSPFVLDLYTSNNLNPITSGTTVTITIAAGALNVGAATDFILSFQNGATVVDTSTVSVGASSAKTVTFNANGGTGSTATQSSSSAAALTTNGYSRSGYVFAGWNTAVDGSGTAYADGASFPFTANTTLYAQWTATLANTGISSATGISLLVGGLSLAIIGAELFMIARRKRSN